MTTAHIVYEMSTGRILLLHQFSAEPADPERDRQFVVEQGDLSEDDVAVVSVSADELDATRLYRVDVNNNALMEAEPGEGGVGFGVTKMSPEDPGDI
jgi:hypothetical protein